MGRAAHENDPETLRVLLVMARAEAREEVRRRLADPALALTLLPAASWAEARLRFQAEKADLILGDLEALERRDLEAGELGALPFCLLIPAGAESQAATRLAAGTVDFILQAGDYHLLLPVLLRRLHRRGESSHEEMARLLRHELNNPLTGILGNAELLLAEAGARPEKTRERLATIIQLAVRLRDLVRDLEQRLRGNGNPGNPSFPAAQPPGLRPPRPVAR